MSAPGISPNSGARPNSSASPPPLSSKGSPTRSRTSSSLPDLALALATRERRTMDIMWNAFILAFAFAAALFPSLAIAPNAPALSVRALPQPRATIIFGGDMMFDRTVRTAMEKNVDDFIFSCIDPVLADADLVVANLEGPITSHASVSATSSPEDEYNYTFTFPVSTASLLRRHGIGMVNIGNNHIMNFGREGLVETRKWLDAAGVGAFGDPGAVEADRGAAPALGGGPFSFVNWSDWTSDKTDHTVAQVRREALEGRV